MTDPYIRHEQHPTFATRPSFLGIERCDADAAICVAGIPYDLGTSNRPGARFGPAAIRQASRMLVDGDHPASLGRDRAARPRRYRRFPHRAWRHPGHARQIEAQASGVRHLVALGGDHTITLALLRALAPRTGPRSALVHFDAHVDTWPDSFGQRLRARLAVLPRDRGGADRSAPHDADRHPLADAPRRCIDWTVGKGVTILSAEEVHEAGPAGRRRADPRGRRRRAGLSELRCRRARPGLRAGHRHARDRRARDLAGAGDPAPARRARLPRHGCGRGVAALRCRRDHRARRGDDRLGIPRAARAPRKSLERAS